AHDPGGDRAGRRGADDRTDAQRVAFRFPARPLMGHVPVVPMERMTDAGLVAFPGERDRDIAAVRGPGKLTTLARASLMRSLDRSGASSSPASAAPVVLLPDPG